MDTVILAQEIIVDNACYPTEKIAQEFARFPAVGFGLRQFGRPVDVYGHPLRQRARSRLGRRITAVMCGQAYLTSARIAEATGPCAGYAVNDEPFLEVIRMHRDATNHIDSHRVPPALYEDARKCWEEAYELGRRAVIATRK